MEVLTVESLDLNPLISRSAGEARTAAVGLRTGPERLR